MRHEYPDSKLNCLADYFTDYYELAELLNCSVRTVNRIMSGKRKLTRREEIVICNYLGRSQESLFIF